MRSYVLAALPLLALAGCGAQSTMPPVSTAAPTPSLSGQPASKAPESANSLPLGSATDAPLTPSVGEVNNTRVGPATRPVRPVRRPVTNTGY